MERYSARWCAENPDAASREIHEGQRATQAATDAYCAEQEGAKKRLTELEAALRLVDEDVRRHLRSDAIGPAMIRPRAVKAVREALSK